jgi:hypothetical protein
MIMVHAALFTILMFLPLSCGKKRDVQQEKADSFTEEEKEVIAAVYFAYSLEEELWEREEDIDEKEDVVVLFRQGFSDELAGRFADYVWIEERGKGGTHYRALRPGEPVLVMPDDIVVEQIEEDKAILLLKYKENPEGPLTWEAHTDIVTMRREDGMWKIYDMKSRDGDN